MLFGIGREIGVARFGGHGCVTLAVPEQNALAEAGAGGDYDLRGLWSFDAAMNRLQFVGFQNAETVGGGFDVVHQVHMVQVQMLRDARTVDQPGKIGGLHAVVDDGSGNAEGGGGDFAAGAIQKIAGDFFQAFMLARGVALIRHAHELALLHVEEPKVGLGSTQVTSQNHSNPPKTCTRADASGGRRRRLNRRRRAARRFPPDNSGTAERQRRPRC